MKFLILFLLLLLSPGLTARTLEIGSVRQYTNLEAAAAAALPGDTILFTAGHYSGDQNVVGLQGTRDAWITITAVPDAEVYFVNGANACHFTDPAWLRIVGIRFIFYHIENGLNINDGGSYDTPAHHVVIERCSVSTSSVRGKYDLLKLSGVDSFEIRNCFIYDGPTQGDLVNMVGCHYGTLTENHFLRGGANSVQVRGGSSHIRIERNRFHVAGPRAISIGGSTDPQSFRPLGANYESSDIYVYSNVFLAMEEAAISYIGAVNSHVINNTIYLPGHWTIRILQENPDPQLLRCGNNSFRNNIVVVDKYSDNPVLNIGPNTLPGTFTFSNNLWYNGDDANWKGPNLPVAETGGIIGSDPMLMGDIVDFSPMEGSRAIGAGYPAAEPTLDFNGKPFATPRSIGAIEGSTTTTSVKRTAELPGLQLVEQPETGSALALFTLPHDATVEALIYDIRGNRQWSHRERHPAGEARITIPLEDLPSGAYICFLRSEGRSLARVMMVR